MHREAVERGIRSHARELIPRNEPRNIVGYFEQGASDDLIQSVQGLRHSLFLVIRFNSRGNFSTTLQLMKPSAKYFALGVISTKSPIVKDLIEIHTVNT